MKTWHIRNFLAGAMVQRLGGLGEAEWDKVQEIRLRAGRPLLLRVAGQELAVHDSGRLAPLGGNTGCYCPTVADMAETLERISQHSLYAYETELQNGYITLPGGHRVGVVGQAVMEAGGKRVQAWRHVGGLNLRVARSVPGCATAVLPHVKTAHSIFHTLIISPPGHGKTTLLRDLVRQLSEGGHTVGLVDERSEVAGCYRGVPQLAVGPRTDVLDGCCKAVGMEMLLRGMAPHIIAVDELGGPQDAAAVQQVLSAGVRLLCTAHGASLQEVRQNPVLAALTQLEGGGVFERYVVLGTPGSSRPGHVAGIFNENGRPVAGSHVAYPIGGVAGAGRQRVGGLLLRRP